MLIFLPNSCRGQISTTIELEKSFPGDHFAEKIILTTDVSGIINTKFPQGLIWRFINHNSNQKWASNQKGGVHIVCQYCYLSRTKWLKFWLRLRIFDWLKNFWVQIFFESVRMRIFDWLSQRFLSPNIFWMSQILKFDSIKKNSESKYFLNPSDWDFSKIQIFLSPNIFWIPQIEISQKSKYFWVQIFFESLWLRFWTQAKFSESKYFQNRQTECLSPKTLAEIELDATPPSFPPWCFWISAKTLEKAFFLLLLVCTREVTQIFNKLGKWYWVFFYFFK